MRALVSFLLVAAVAVSFAGCQRQRPADGPNIDCVERLEVPTYPPIAESARISAIVTTAIVLGPQGTLNSIAIDGVMPASAGRPARPIPLFNTSVDRAIRSSKFSSACGGKTVRVIFNFRLSSRTDLPPATQPVAFHTQTSSRSAPHPESSTPRR